MSRHVGIMGGMFDPVHLGHLQAATAARDFCRLDEVRLIPCGNPVHRDAALSAAEHRCAMLELALAEYPGLLLDRRECESAALSRTRDTLASLKQEMPQAALFFIMGLDAFLGMATWYRWQEIPQLANLLVISRPGYQLTDQAFTGEQAGVFRHELGSRITQDPEKFRSSESGNILLAALETPDLSSTLVRQLLKQGGSLEGVLPAAVSHYIEVHHLYR